MRRTTSTLVALLAVLGLVWTASMAARTAATRPGSSYPDTVLSQASLMTQQMSVPGPPTGHEYHIHAGDGQLQLSSNPGFIRAIDAYQNQIDRMLARTP